MAGGKRYFQSQHQRSSVSPMSQVILERSNTSSLAKQLVTVAGHMQELDHNILKTKDQHAGPYLSLKGILTLFFQWRVGVVAVFHMAVFLSAALDKNVRLSYVGVMGTYGSMSIMGWVVGLMIAFRQNQGMLRWWEGRSAWGRLTNVSRDVVRAVLAHNNDKDTSMSFAMYTIAFSITMKNFLRGDAERRDPVELKLLLGEVDLFWVTQARGIDRVLAILDLMSGILVQMTNKGSMETQVVLLVVEPKLSEMNHLMGTAWRIKDTPIPQMYRVFLDLVVALFLTTLPFALLSSAWYPGTGFFLCTAISCMLNGLTKLAGQMEDPFETDPNDLPLGKYTAAIMHQIMQTTDRWYRPNSILHSSKMEQKRISKLEEKIRRAQLKANVVGRLRTSIGDRGAKGRETVAKPLPAKIEEQASGTARSSPQATSHVAAPKSESDITTGIEDVDSDSGMDKTIQALEQEEGKEHDCSDGSSQNAESCHSESARAKVAGEGACDAGTEGSESSDILTRPPPLLNGATLKEEFSWQDVADEEEARAVKDYLKFVESDTTIVEEELDPAKGPSRHIELPARSLSTPSNIASSLETRR